MPQRHGGVDAGGAVRRDPTREKRGNDDRERDDDQREWIDDGDRHLERDAEDQADEGAEHKSKDYALGYGDESGYEKEYRRFHLEVGQTAAPLRGLMKSYGREHP
jgi:hypothetical protein